MSTGRIGRRELLVLAGLATVALALRATHLGGQVLIPDDLDVGRTARNFVDLGWPEPTMWNHPRLRDLLVRASISALGDGPWGLKLWSVVLGTLSVPCLAAIVLAVTGSLPAAAIAGLLLAVDPLHVDFSRQGINDVYLAFLVPAALCAIVAYGRTRRVAWLTAAGAFLGLGIASKWSAVFPVAVVGAAVLGPSLLGSQRLRSRLEEAAVLGACLLLLPLAIYLLTFWPWFARGHDLGEWLRLQALMARETATHTGYPGTKLPGFPGEVVGAWRWFVQPIWYVDYVPPMPPGSAPLGVFVSGVANPLAWLATLPAAGWAAWRALRERDRAAGGLLLAFLAAWVPFVLVRRPIWANSAVAVAPFAFALVGWAAARLHERFPAYVRLWLGAAIAVAALLWLPSTGRSAPPSDAAVRMLVSPAALDPATHR